MLKRASSTLFSPLPKRLSSRPSLLLACIFFLIISIGFWKIWILDAAPRVPGPLTVDLYQMFLPWYTYMALSFRNFQIPLWFPYAGAGVPFLATPHTAILYPPNLLYLFVSPPLGMGILAIFHLMLCGAGTFLFCRLHGIGKFGSAFAGLGYMFSNSVWINYNSHYLAGVAWLPVVFFVAEKLYRQPSLVGSLVLAAVVALQFLSGGGQFFLYTIYFLLLYVALRLVYCSTEGVGSGHRIRFGGFLIFSLVLALILSSAQLLPSIELLRNSVRSEPLPKELVQFPQWYFEWWFPFLNLLDSQRTVMFKYMFHWGGLLQAFFLLFALIKFRERRLHIFVVLFILSVVLSTGYSTPLYKYFAMLPGLAQSRQPNRLAVVTAFTVAFLSALGVENFLQLRKEYGRVTRLSIFASAAGSLGLLLWLVHSRANFIFLLAGMVLLGAALAIDRRRVAYAALGLVICLGALETGTRYKPEYSHPQAVPEYLFPSEIRMLDEVKGIVGDDRIFVEERGVPPHPFAVYRGGVHGLYSITDYHPAISSRMEDLIEAITGSKPVYPDGRIVLTADAARPDILDLFSVRYFLMFKQDNVFDEASPGSPMAEFRRGLRVVREFPGYILYENMRALPRAYLARGATVAGNRFEALRQLLSGSFPHTAALLEGESAREALPPPVSPESLNTTGSDMVHIASLSQRKVAVDVVSRTGGLLVLTDSYYPGWTAEIDGEPASMYRANYLFRAVSVPAGQHTVEFSYLPASFLAGAGLSAAGLIILTAGLVYSFRRRRLSGTSDEAAVSSSLAVAGPEDEPVSISHKM